MKRWILFLILGLLVRLVDAAVLPLGAVPALESSHTGMVAMQHHEGCAVDHGALETDSPVVQHTLPQCHSCCPSIGLQPALDLFLASPSPRPMGTSPLVRHYTDITYSIDKPPKTAV